MSVLDIGVDWVRIRSMRGLWCDTEFHENVLQLRRNRAASFEAADIEETKAVFETRIVSALEGRSQQANSRVQPVGTGLGPSAFQIAPNFLTEANKRYSDCSNSSNQHADYWIALNQTPLPNGETAQRRS